LVSTPPDPLVRRNELSEASFKTLLAAQAGEFLQVSNGLMEMVPEQWSQRQLYSLYRAATDLETFLDDFGARENRTFFPVRELVAMVRWLSLGMSSLVHLHLRLPSYALPSPEWSQRVLGPEVQSGALRLGEMVLGSLEALRNHWKELGMEWATEAHRLEVLGTVGARPQLPRNLIEDRSQDLGRLPSNAPAAGRLAARFLDLVDDMERSGLTAGVGDDPAARRTFAADRLSETFARSMEARIHSLQSSYDSQVAGTREEEAHPELLSLRGSASVGLHLWETATALIHLYERHDVYGDHRGARHLFARYLSEARILTIAISLCVQRSYDVFKKASEVAEELLGELTEVTEVVVDVPDGVSLHARPASLIVSVARHHGTPVVMEIDGRRCNAASIMQVLVLAGSHPRARQVKFRGDQAVLEDLRLLFEHRLGEAGLTELPARLSYLRQG